MPIRDARLTWAVGCGGHCTGRLLEGAIRQLRIDDQICKLVITKGDDFNMVRELS